MEIIYILFLFFVNICAPVLLVIGLIWGCFALRRLYRERKSLAASKGDEAAMSVEKARLKASLFRVLGVVLWIVVFVSIFILTSGSGFGLAFYAACFCSGVCFLWASVIKKRYNVSFKENIVKAELSKVFDNLSYEPNGKFGGDSISSLDFFTSIDGVDGNDLIDASYKGVHFTQCDLGVQEQYTVTVKGRKGHSRTENRWRDVFRGRAMRFDFADNFRGRVQVVAKDFDGAKVRSSRGNWQRVETELAEFGRQFDVFALDPLDAMAVLTPQMIEGIFYLRKALGVAVAFYFIENTMVVFMALYRETFDVSGKRTLLEERELLKRDIALVTAFLGVMYFKTQASENPDSADTSTATRAAIDRAAAAAAAAGSVGPSMDEKLVRGAKRVSGKIRTYLPYTIIAVFLVSAVYGFINLPDELAAGASYSDGAWIASPDSLQVPTIGYLIVSGIFIIIPALKKSFVVSSIVLAIYLLFMLVNI